MYQSIVITGDSLYYLALHDSMSPDRNYMLYVVSDSVDTVEFDYYLYHFTSKTATPICDRGFDAEIILGGLAATNSIWLDNHIVRIFPYSDEIGFSDHFISNDGTILTKTYTYNEYNDISLLKNDTLYFGSLSHHAKQ